MSAVKDIMGHRNWIKGNSTLDELEMLIDALRKQLPDGRSGTINTQ